MHPDMSLVILLQHFIELRYRLLEIDTAGFCRTRILRILEKSHWERRHLVRYRRGFGRVPKVNINRLI